MPNSYTYGSEVNLTATFVDKFGNAAAPAASPTIAVTNPEDTVVNYTATSSPAWTNPSTGVYRISILADKVGRWHYNPFVPSTGYPTTDNDPISEELSFIVEPAEGQTGSLNRILSSDELKDILGLDVSITAQEVAVLSMVHAQSESAVIAHLGYDPKQAARTQFYPRRGQYEGVRRGGSFLDVNAAHTQALVIDSALSTYLQLENLPVRSIASVNVDRNGHFDSVSGAFGSGTAWTEGVDFYPEWDESGLCRSGILTATGGWPVVTGSVKVVYTGGFTKAELNGLADVNATGIKRAVMLTAVKAFVTWQMVKKKGLAGFTAGPLKSERLGDYNYSLGGMSDAFAGMAIALPAEAVDELSPFVHYGVDVL